MMFDRQCGIDWRAYLVATDEEIESERTWASQRPSVLTSERPELHSVDNAGRILRAFNDNEFERYGLYKALYPGEVF